MSHLSLCRKSVELLQWHLFTVSVQQAVSFHPVIAMARIGSLFHLVWFCFGTLSQEAFCWKDLGSSLSSSPPPHLILPMLGWAGGQCAIATITLPILVTRIWLSSVGLTVGHHSRTLSKLFQRYQTWDSPNFLASLASFLESTIPKPMLLGSRT